MKTTAADIVIENKFYSKTFRVISFLLLFTFVITANTMAQSSTQVTITGIPSILPTPFADDIENNFASGRYQVMFNYTSQINQPVDFVFHFIVKKENRTIVDIQSEPRAFTPGSYVFINFFEELIFPQSSDEVLRGLPREIQNQMIQSGVVPEGRYTIEIEARPATQRTMSIIPGIANFSVRYPPPPILVSPSMESNVTQEVPVFAWTPVISSRGRVIEYDFLLVEVFEGQTPLQAIEGNRALAEQTLAGSTTLPYTFEFLPLEEGSRYAWQVTARDGAGEMPLQDDGESEIYTFTYREAEEVPLAELQDIEEIIIIPEFARIISLNEVSANPVDDAYDLTGSAQLELDFEEYGLLQTEVDINLLVQPQSTGSPMVIGGNVEGGADLLENILPDPNPWIDFEDLYWSFGDPFRADLSLLTPDQQWVEADGELTIDRRGLSGMAEVSGDPLTEYTSEYLDITVQALGVEFPGNRFWAEGDAKVMGFDTPCELQNFNMLDGIVDAGVLCNERMNIPLVDNSEFLTMQVNRVRGDIQISPNTSDFDYSVDVQSLVGLQTIEGRYCGASTSLNLSSSDGLNIETGHSKCAILNPKIDLGFAEVRFENTDISFLEYDSVAEQWDFELTFDGNLEVPAFDDWSSLTMTGIGVTPDGISFESINFGDDESVNPLPAFDAQVLEIALESFGLTDFTFPVFDWDEQAPGPWEINFAGSAMIQSGTGVPMCLLGTSLDATNGRVDQDRVISNLSMGNFEGCQWEIGPGYEIHVDALSGIAGVEYPAPDEIQPFGNINLSGDLTLGYPFDCGDETFSFSEEELILSDGIQGTLTNVVPQCPLNVGPFTAQVTDSDIEFSVNDRGAQQAIMSAEAFVQLPDGLQVQGSVVINLMTGEFIDVSFIIDEPFDWNIPSDEEPVLSFRLNHAEITQNGFLVDGRHRFLLPNSQMGVTFDNLLIDLSTFSIQHGRIIFDEEFAFEVGISDDLSDLTFQSVETDSDLSLDPGILMELGGNIQIDSLGVHTSGTAEASLAFSGRNYDSLVTVEYSDDFQLDLYPFSVTSGQADFYFDGDRFAFVDPSGFNPVAAFFAEYLIPERLPLPTEDIAYLQLRNDDELLVDVTEDQNGNLQISSIPGQSLSLVVPYIDPGSPPTLADVTLEDLVISANPYSPEILSGSITADVPADDPAFTLTDKNVPVSIERIQFGSRDVNGSSISALFMMGNLHLFDQEIEDDNYVEFYLRGDGYVRAAFDISGMDSQLSIAPQDRVLIGVDALRGSFDMPVDSGSPNYDFSVGGSVEVLTDEGYRAGADMTIRTESGGFFTISDFDGYAFDDTPGIGIGDFRLDLDEIVDIPEFSYSTQDGFDFSIELDLSFNLSLSNGEEINFPLKDIAIRDDGIHFPTQIINESEVPGLDLPSVDLLGFNFQPLAFNTPSAFSYSWQDGASLDLDFAMDFAVEIPEFIGSGIHPSDGFLFLDVGFDDGFLTGSLDPIELLSPPEISLGSGSLAPSLLVEEISGGLEKISDNGFSQGIDFDINGTIADLPAFTKDDTGQCPEGAEYSLSVVEGKAFEGTVTNIQPCGYLELGPVTLEVPSADLEVYLDQDEQMATLDGNVDVTLPSPGQGAPGIISGNLVLDVMTGRIHDGSIAITQPFGLNMPYYEDQNPLFTFGVNQATLDADGLTLNGTGNLEKGQIDASVTFDDLLLGLPDFGINGGSATINSSFAVQFDINPLGFELVPENEPLPSDNALRMDLSANVTLDQHGLSFDGSSDATLLYNSEQYSNLRVELVDDFAMSITELSVTRGQAEFYWDEDGVPATMPIAYIDINGFHFGSGLLAFLPDRIPLPSEDIAYIDIKDSDGNPLVEVESQAQGTGFSISTDGDFLQMVVPALPDNAGNDLTVGVSFSLETDDAYNVTGGSLTLQSDYSLEDRLNLPVTLTELEVSDDNGLTLGVGLNFELPAVFENHGAEVFATLSSSGIESGLFSVGEVGSSYDPGLNPIYTYDYSGSVQGSSEQDIFEANLLGIEAEFGTNSISFAGTLNSSLVIDDGDDPVFFNASWSGSDWAFTLDPGGAAQELRLGQVAFFLDDYEPLDIVFDDDDFYLTINGQVSFEDVLDEDIQITVQGLQVGVSDFETSPSLHFDIGSTIGNIGDQQIGLFEDALVLNLINPSISLSGRGLAINTDGNLTFLEKQVNYTGLEISTAGLFQLDQVSLSDVGIFEDYLILKSFALSFDEGPRVDSELEINLPAPVEEYSTTGNLAIYRENNQIVVDNSGLELDLDERYELDGFGDFELSKIKADVDPLNWNQTGVYANGDVYLSGESDPVIEFGKANDFPNQAGVGITYTVAQDISVDYNITGNASFEFDFNFFRIDVTANMNSSSGSGFEITLGGVADMNLEAVEASLMYSGILITEEGLENYGNIQGGSIDVIGVASISVGQFIYESDTDGFMIDVANTSEMGPEELQEDGDFSADEVDTDQLEVIEILCFGPCPETGDVYDGPAIDISIGGDANSESGGIGGGVDRIAFYQTSDGLRSLTIENLHVEMDDIFQMNASINYEQQGNDVLLRAAATGSFEIGGSEASAVVAGKFAKVSGQVSYGLFVAVQSDVGIPIVPGILDLTGAGGGFFYKPVQEDLDMVHGSMDYFGHSLVNSESASIQGDADFAVMLYAAIGVAGAGDSYIMEGSTFFQITSQSYYMDARAFLLGMDGDNTIANTEISGEMFASVQRDPFAILLGVEVVVSVPVIIDGGGNIEFFYVEKEDSENPWGIIGNVSFDVYGGILGGDADLYAGNPGFMFEVTLSFDLDLKILDVKSDVTGAVWIIQDPDYQFPFGAYVEFDVEATVLKIVTVSAGAKAAFATIQAGGYEFFATAYGCASVLGASKCGHAWASYSDTDGLDYGTGKGNHADLVAQARNQKNQFEDHINNLLTEVAAAVDELESPSPIPLEDLFPDEEMYIEAGINFYQLPKSERVSWVNVLQQAQQNQFSPASGYNPQFVSNTIYNDIMAADAPYVPADMDPESTKNILDSTFGTISSALQDWSQVVSEDIFVTTEYVDQAEAQYDQMMVELANSPVEFVNKPSPSTEADESVDFSVNESQAGQQQNSIEEYSEMLSEMNTQFLNNINDVSNNLDAMDDFLIADGGILGDMEIVGWMAVNKILIESFDKYYASLANKFWSHYYWAQDLRSTLNQNEPSISGLINSENQTYRASAEESTSASSQYVRNSLDNNAWRVAQRIHFASILADGDYSSVSLPSPQNSDFSNVSDIYNRLSYSLSDPVDDIMDEVSDVNQNFWYEMHDNGLSTYSNAMMQGVVDEVWREYNQDKESMFTPMVGISQLLDQFFQTKANLTSILFNMIDNYLEWRGALDENVQLDASMQTYMNERTQLSESLLPPQITDITVSPYREDGTYFNETEIDWNATHPVEIIENSIQYNYQLIGGDRDIYALQDEYISVGGETEHTLYPLNFAVNTMKVSLGVRVRGAAGNTAFRRAVFDVDVGPGGSTTAPGTQVLPDDTDPPAQPEILLSENYNSTSNGNDVTYWTSNPNNLNLVINGSDPEVGISRFEYAVGTEPGEDNIIGWTELQGQRETLSNIPAEQMKGPSQFLGMEPGDEYYISARVENNMGQMSPVNELQAPIVFDDTAPENVNAQVSFVAIQTFSFYGFSTVVHPVLTTVPEFNPTSQQQEDWSNTYGVPKIEYSGLSADDQESGISHFEYVFSRQSSAPQNVFNSGDFEIYENGDLMIEGTDEYPKFGRTDGPVLDTFQRNIYLHFRAIDRAGNRSEIQSIGPHKSNDSTAPRSGKLQAKTDADDVKLYLIDVPYDPESDLLGIQYSIGTTPEDEDVRPWPSGNEVDKEWNQQMTNSLLGIFSYQDLNLYSFGSQLNQMSSVKRYLNIPTADLPIGDDLYIRYRSVNTRGSKSTVQATGPINMDTSPPELPDANVDVNLVTRKIELDISNITDPESGIKKVEYWVEKASVMGSGQFQYHTWTTYISNQPIQTYSEPQHNTLSLSTESSAISDDQELTDLRVRIRITNGAGVTRIKTVHITDNDTYYPIQTFTNQSFQFGS